MLEESLRSLLADGDATKIFDERLEGPRGAITPIHVVAWNVVGLDLAEMHVLATGCDLRRFGGFTCRASHE